MIVAGTMGSSAVKEGAGARTEVSNLVAWVAVVISLVFLAPVFKSLPEAVLAALIIHALWHIIGARKLKRVWLETRTEFVLGGFALLGVLFIDVLEGMMIGLVASLLWFIYRSTRANLSSLGRASGARDVFSDISRHPDDVPVPGLMILRLNSPLFYANAHSVRDRVMALVDDAVPPPRALLLDLAAQDDLDVTSAEMLKKLFAELQRGGLTVYLAEVHAPVREFGRRVGLLDVIPEDTSTPPCARPLRCSTDQSRSQIGSAPASSRGDSSLAVVALDAVPDDLVDLEQRFAGSEPGRREQVFIADRHGDVSEHADRKTDVEWPDLTGQRRLVEQRREPRDETIRNDLSICPPSRLEVLHVAAEDGGQLAETVGSLTVVGAGPRGGRGALGCARVDVREQALSPPLQGEDHEVGLAGRKLVESGDRTVEFVREISHLELRESLCRDDAHDSVKQLFRAAVRESPGQVCPSGRMLRSAVDDGPHANVCPHSIVP